ncbi:hypothetical protein H632_c502p2 [Helicosporidium sp. ATCC 50920]|nr:hypothetical protein H632_c502p2 [Helicosporidium sp. ATCC 50920]|eukprot:KDD75781.1 hypothetical protein H632_c502p2 [Helicosporidium sp. ATCC 50920]
MWYLANPENNRKVVERAPGEWWCEHSGSRVPKPVRRFVFQARIVDQGGEAFCQVFDDAGQALLRQTADQLAEARQGDRPEAFKAALRAACWETWSLRLRLTVQEYNGELRKRYAVADVQPMDWALESRRMIQALQG